MPRHILSKCEVWGRFCAKNKANSKNKNTDPGHASNVTSSLAYIWSDRETNSL